MRTTILFVTRAGSLALDYTLGTAIVLGHLALAGRRGRLTRLPTTGIEFGALH